MGTNFYWIERPPLPATECPTCGHTEEYDEEGGRKHIGKSSAGWCFSLHVYPEEGINDLFDWEGWFNVPGSYIEDEYGDRCTVKEMVAKITERSWEGNTSERTPEFYRRNHAVPGPNGLMRSVVDGFHCIAHGAGTWDCIVGEFS